MDRQSGIQHPNHHRLGGLSGSDDLAFGANSLGIGANNASTTFAGALGGSGSLTKTGGGTLTLAGTNTYTGVTPVSAGTLAMTAANRIANSSKISIAGGAKLDYNLSGSASFLPTAPTQSPSSRNPNPLGCDVLPERPPGQGIPAPHGIGTKWKKCAEMYCGSRGGGIHSGWI